MSPQKFKLKVLSFGRWHWINAVGQQADKESEARLFETLAEAQSAQSRELIRDDVTCAEIVITTV